MVAVSEEGMEYIFDTPNRGIFKYYLSPFRSWQQTAGTRHRGSMRMVSNVLELFERKDEPGLAASVNPWSHLILVHLI
jgi:hypothetical protein